MVTWLEVMGAWMLTTGVKLGIPVVVLFVLGHALHRQRSRGSYAQAAVRLGRETKSRVWAERGHKRSPWCWEIRQCSSEERERCPAFWQRQVPCWRAVKQASGGYIQSRCLGCSLLLSR